MIEEGTCDRLRMGRSFIADSSAGPKAESRSGSTGCDANGENFFLNEGKDRCGVVSGWASRIDSTDGRYTDKGMRLRSSPPLTSTGELMSNSLGFDPHRFLELARFEASLSFRALKSAKMGVEGK